MEEEVKEIIEEKIIEEKPEDIKSPIIEAAKLENDRKEDLLKKEEELIKRREKIHAEELVGGRSMAGQIPEKPKPLTDEEYADKMMKGELDPLVDDGFR